MSAKTMSSEDPWQSIEPPKEAARISGRRVDPQLPWDLFWALDGDGQCLLVLQHGTETTPSRRLPRLRGLRVEAQAVSEGQQLVIRLVDREQRAIFYRFCTDVVRACALAKTEQEAVARFLGRTWSWHRLLSTGRDTRLTDEQQRGLIGELRLIEEHLLPLLGAAAAVRCWTGPLDAPRDFEISTLHIEAKTRGPTRNAVVISSPQQLDLAGCESLFLYVVQIVAATGGPTGGTTVAEAAKRVHSAIQAMNPTALDAFEERLLATGFDWDHDYSDQAWLVTGETLFEVRDDFPRLTPDMIPASVENVSYRLALQGCEDYQVGFAVLEAAVRGDNDGT